MPKDNSLNGIHAQRLKQIRKFVDFDYDLRHELTAYQKRKIKKYHDEIRILTARPYHAYRPRKAENLKRAQQFAQHETNLPGLKVAFIPTDGENVPRIRFDKQGRVSATTDHVITRGLDIDTDALIADPLGHIADVIAREPDAKRFTVRAGPFEIPKPHSRGTIGRYVAQLMSEYSDKDANNYHGNWLHGLNAHSFTNQADFDSYNKAKNDNKKEMQRERRNERQRQYRAKEKAALEKLKNKK